MCNQSLDVSTNDFRPKSSSPTLIEMGNMDYGGINRLSKAKSVPLVPTTKSVSSSGSRERVLRRMSRVISDETSQSNNYDESQITQPLLQKIESPVEYLTLLISHTDIQSVGNNQKLNDLNKDFDKWMHYCNCFKIQIKAERNSSLIILIKKSCLNLVQNVWFPFTFKLTIDFILCIQNIARSNWSRFTSVPAIEAVETARIRKRKTATIATGATAKGDRNTGTECWRQTNHSS